MNLLKEFLFYSLLLNSYNLYTQETPKSDQSPSATTTEPVKDNKSEIAIPPVKTSPETPKPEAQTAVVPATTTKPTEKAAPVKEEPKTEEKTELTAWQDHLKSVLVKGEAWDTANNTLKSEWQDKAFELAQAVVKKDISSADELIKSFEDTVNEKFTTIEKAINYKGYSGIIDLFKDKIKALVTELSPKEKKQEDNAQVNEQEKSSSEEPIKEENILGTEEKTTEENMPQKEELSASEKAEKKKEKRESEWLECLENIRANGVSAEEVQGILKEAARIAKKLLSSLSDDEQKDKATILKSEFKNAVNERSTELSSINESTAIAQFNNEINTVIRNKNPEGQEPFMDSHMPQEDNSLQKNKPNGSTTQEKNPPAAANPGQQKTASPQITYVTTITQGVTSTGAVDRSLAQKQAEAAEKTRIKAAKESQDLADALKIKIAAAQTKTGTKKGIISSIMEKVFGSWWTKESGTVEEMHQKQDDLIKDRIRPLDSATQYEITTAYELFQKTLLDFDSKKFWNSDPNISNTYKKQWIKDIKTASEVLIKFNIMNVEIIIDILKEAFGKKITAQQYDELKGLIEPGLKQYAAGIENEKAKIQSRKEEELAIKQQEELNREKEKKENAELAIKQQEQERIAKIKRFPQLEKEWNTLMKQIATSKPTSEAKNIQFTEKALQLTEDMFKLLSFFPKKNKNDITTKHIEEFSQALIEQGKRNKGSNPHKGDPLRKFNAQIHKIAEKYTL